MTENEAKEMLAKHYEFLRESWKPYPDRKVLDAIRVAISSIDKVNQYRAIGTVEECREARERQMVKNIIHNPCGGVDEDWLCPSCGRFCSPYAKHCQHCGQAVKVGDTSRPTK